MKLAPTLDQLDIQMGLGLDNKHKAHLFSKSGQSRMGDKGDLGLGINGTAFAFRRNNVSAQSSSNSKIGVQGDFKGKDKDNFYGAASSYAGNKKEKKYKTSTGKKEIEWHFDSGFY